METEQLSVNHTVQIDIMFIDKRPVLHKGNLGTNVSPATLLRNQATEEVWRCIQAMWNLVYVVPPDFLQCEQGSNHISAEIKSVLSASGVILKEANVESPSTIGHVERYHASLKHAYRRFRQGLDLRYMFSSIGNIFGK